LLHLVGFFFMNLNSVFNFIENSYPACCLKCRAPGPKFQNYPFCPRAVEDPRTRLGSACVGKLAAAESSHVCVCLWPCSRNIDGTLKRGGHQDVGARTGQVVEPVRVTSAGTLTGHNRLLFPPDADSNTVCCMRPMPLDKQAWMGYQFHLHRENFFCRQTARRRADDIDMQSTDDSARSAVLSGGITPHILNLWVRWRGMLSDSLVRCTSVAGISSVHCMESWIDPQTSLFAPEEQKMLCLPGIELRFFWGVSSSSPSQ